MLALIAASAGPSFLRIPLPQQVALYTSDTCLGHNPGEGHPEQPERLARLLKAMREEWVPTYGKNLVVRDPTDADVTEEQLLRVHTPQHLRKVNSAFGSLQVALGQRCNIDSDTICSPGSKAAAKRAAGLVIAAVDDVLRRPRRSPSRAFVMARPPGHHAEAATPMGFCLYNNVLVGVAHAQAVHGLQRIAVLDFDVHHGNGDADIIASDPRLLYCSSHEVPNYPGTGQEEGRDGEHRNVVNVPLPAGCGSSAFRRAWRDTLLPAVRAFRPEAIFVSAGFDAHGVDPLSSTTLSDADFAWLTSEVVRLGVGARLPVISVLEGGYNLEQLPKSVRTHVHALVHS